MDGCGDDDVQECLGSASDSSSNRGLTLLGEDIAFRSNRAEPTRRQGPVSYHFPRFLPPPDPSASFPSPANYCGECAGNLRAWILPSSRQ